MNPESRPEIHPDPPEELAEEMSLSTALHRVVDDLFTYQAIAEKISAIEGDTATNLVQTWKRDVVEQLEKTAQQSLQNVAATLELMQLGGTPSITETERLEWQQIEAWHKPFIVASICREDLRTILTDEEIATLDDSDMENIADRMSDAHRDSGVYWESLEIAARHVLQRN